MVGADGRYCACVFFAQYIADFNPIIFGRRIDNGVGGNDFVFLGNNILQSRARQIHVDNRAVHKTAAGADSVERASSSPHIGTDQIGNKQSGFAFDTDTGGFCLFLQIATRISIRRLEFQSQTP